jgi:hypothetical protein
MCCLASAMALFGPRVAIVLWWIFDSVFVRDAFPHVFWLIVGILFAPWTALFYLFAFVGGADIVGWDWVLIAVGIFFDIASYSGGAYNGQKRYAA